MLSLLATALADIFVNLAKQSCFLNQRECFETKKAYLCFMQKWLLRLLYLIDFTLALALLLSYSAKYISPSLSILIAFFGMAYSYLLVSFILISILLIVLKKRKLLIINLLVIVFGWSNLSSWIQFNSSNNTPSDFRILSYNVRLFDLYNWKHNQESKRKILAFLKKQDADIISFQEFYYDNKTFLIDSVSEALNMPYYYVTDSRFVLGFEHFGQAIFSKYPIQSSKLIKFPNTTNMSLYCDIKIKKNKLIRVFSNHLESYRFAPNDYQLMDDIRQKKTDIKNVPGLVERLELALVKRSYQAEKIAALVNSSPYPVIVTGDFNDTPNSYTYHQISRYLSDAFIENGVGFSNTYKGAFPSFRIDYILYGKGLKSISYKRLKFNASDHFPIYSDFVFEINN